MHPHELIARAHQAVVDHIGDSTRPPVPDNAALADLARFGEVSLDDPVGAAAAVELLAEVGARAATRLAGGRYFGFVNGGLAPEAQAAASLAGAWDQNAALPIMSPLAAAIDKVAAAWLVDLLGLPAESTAAFCAGATIANTTGIVAARDALLDDLGWRVDEQGLRGAPPIDVVASDEVHVSVIKALRVAGFGTSQITRIPTDANGALDATALPRPGAANLVIAQAGNVNTGHSDPFDEIADHYAGTQRWIHVDGAFGLWAQVAPERRAAVAGVERADSWATDAHKWLNVPYDCGVVICADGHRLAQSMRMDAAYVPSGTERSLMNLGLQMSQAARAVPTWAVLASRGRVGIADAIEQTCRRAERFADGLGQAGVEVLAPVVLNQVIVSFGSDETTDAVVEAVQRSGVCWMGATTWKQRRAMRISVSDFATTDDDVDRSVDAVVKAWHQIGSRS